MYYTKTPLSKTSKNKIGSVDFSPDIPTSSRSEHTQTMVSLWSNCYTKKNINLLRDEDSNSTEIPNLPYWSVEDGVIDSLPHDVYVVIQPIPFKIDHNQDGWWTACFVQADIYVLGDSPEDARTELSEDIVRMFSLLLREEATLGPGPRQQLAVLREYVRPKG